MGVNFNAEFNKLNTNKTEESANILDADEVKAAKQNNSVWSVSEGMTAEAFKSANEHCSTYDGDHNGYVSVDEQKESIANRLKNVWTSRIARFFKDGIDYDNSKEEAAQQVNEQVKKRQDNALEYIEYAKNNNVDIFIDNTNTGVDEQQKTSIRQDVAYDHYDRRAVQAGEEMDSDDVSVRSRLFEGGVEYNLPSGDTVTYNDDSLKLSSSTKIGSHKLTKRYNYNEDGSYSYDVKAQEGYGWTKVQVDKNNNMIENTGFYTTEKGNVKAYAQEGETAEQTLTRLGITDPADRAAVMKANPKAAQNKWFVAGTEDVYIPKSVIENMKKNGTYDEDKLAGKPQA